jgi:hypothetical protein
MAPRKKMTSEELAVFPDNKNSAEVPFKEVKKTTTTKESAIKKAVKPEKIDLIEAAPPIPSEGLSSEPDTFEIPASYKANRGALILGGGLLLMGIFLLMGRLLSIPFGEFLWPFIFIIPGALVFLSALASDSSSGEGLSILGAILMTLGLVFLAQQITSLWASWAYVWALIAPTSIGVAQIVYGTRKERDAIVQSGKKLVNLGLYMFVIGFVFFELIIGINGFGIGNLGLPVFPMVLVFSGVIILVRALTKNR